MSLPRLQAVFLDRDGTLGGSDEMILPGAFECYPSVPESTACTYIRTSTGKAARAGSRRSVF